MATLGRIAPRRRAERGVLRLFAALFVVALALLVARDTPVIAGASGALTSALAPVEGALAQAGSGLASAGEAISEIQRLRADNARLRDEVDRLNLENVSLREQAIAARQAAGLEQAARSVGLKTIPAPVIGRDPSGVVMTVLLGAGTGDGVKIGQVVISQQGVVGRVSQVGPSFSKVLLVTDATSTVAALVQGSRATGIVRGQYGDTLVMDWILQTEQVAVGDVVITAGLSVGEDLRSLYPKGLVIGTVVGLDAAESSAFKRAIVLPAVDLRHLEHVLILESD